MYRIRFMHMLIAIAGVCLVWRIGEVLLSLG